MSLKTSMAIRKEIDRELVKRIPLSAISHLLLLGIGLGLSPIFTDLQEAQALARVLTFLAFIRLFFGVISNRLLTVNRMYWMWGFRTLVGAGGLCWGLIGTLAIQKYGIEKQSVLLLLPIAGVASGSITSLYYEPGTLIFFIVAAILPGVVAEILLQTPESLSLAAMSILYLFFLIVQARTVSHTAIKAIRFRHSSMTEREKTQAILEALPGYISWVDLDGNYRGVNERLARFFNLTPADFVGKPLGFLASQNGFAIQVSEFLKSGRKEDLIEFKGGWTTGAPWLLIALKRYRFVDHEEVIIVAIDINDKKSAEKQLEEARAASIQSSKLAALGEMAGGVAHEINNPLAIIQGKANQLLKAVKNGDINPELFATQLEKISATSERIAKIVRGLRAFSRNAERDPFVPAQLGRVFDDTLSLCVERFRNQGVRVEVGEIPELTLSCRPAQISQVLLNLLNNAYDAMDRLPEKWVRLEAKVNGESITISVTDAGLGIPAPVAEKLMQPFFTTKELGRGTGLGLSISKGIVEEHGGRLFLDLSCQNTRFVAELPLKRVETLQAAA